MNFRKRWRELGETALKKLVMLAAGGTGGHLFPAQALAEELVGRGLRVQLMTDERMRDYGKDFPAEAVHVIPSATLSLSRPLRAPGQMLRLWQGYATARRLLKQTGAVAVAGFGGYPSLPPLMAATRLALPSLIHEQNAVLGRANRLLARRVSAVALSFEKVMHVPKGAKTTHTGNPVRAIVRQFAGNAYPSLQEGSAINLLIFGGSQGARFFAEMMPAAIAAMPESFRQLLRVTQQCREEDLVQTADAYRRIGVQADIHAFFDDMPRRMAASHLVVCRSGASSIAELGVIGRPAVLVPLPGAIDNDQLRNAESFEAAGAGWLKPQSGIEKAGLATFLSGLLSNADGLKEAAAAALRHGKPDAARRLADLLQNILAA